MNIDTEKIQLIEQLVHIDDIALLQEVKRLLEDHAVGHQSEMGSLLEEDMFKRTHDSEEAIKQGKVISLADVEAEAKDW